MTKAIIVHGEVYPYEIDPSADLVVSIRPLAETVFFPLNIKLENLIHNDYNTFRWRKGKYCFDSGLWVFIFDCMTESEVSDFLSICLSGIEITCLRNCAT